MNQDLALTIVTSEGQLRALREEWSGLFARCAGAHLSQSAMWAENAWRWVAEPRGRALVCLVVRADLRLVALWPTVTFTERGLKVLRPLGYEGSEYSLPLIEDGSAGEGASESASAGECAALIWSAVRSIADLAVLPQIKTRSTFAQTVQARSISTAAYWPAPAPYVERKRFRDWDHYQATVPSSLRSEIRRAQRRLAERGRVTLERQGAGDCAALIDWMIAQKSSQLSATGKFNDWIDRAEYRDFLVAMASVPDSREGGVAVFALRLDGLVIAAHLVSFDRTRAEGFLIAYDRAWRDFSPGNVLGDHVLRWAFDRGLDFDFRPGDDSYKSKWATAEIPTATWLVATGWRGLPRVGARRLALAIERLRMRVALGSRMRRLLHELLQVGGLRAK